ncbi:MAG: hypothetical protein ACLQVK_15690 [Acidimicrobiales bacterium]
MWLTGLGLSVGDSFPEAEKRPSASEVVSPDASTFGHAALDAVLPYW